MSTKYTQYIIEHKENVLKAYLWLKEHGITELAIDEQINAHDMSKYTEEEYDPYDAYFYGNKTKKVKENVKDEKTLEGINMLERAIISGFEKLGVEKIEAVGLPLDPNVHNALAVAKNEDYEDDIVLEEFQAGYKMGDKIIRCSQVLVNKL